MSQVHRPELTARAVVLAVLFAIVMMAATCYLGLRVGMTVGASIPCAVLAMALLRRPRETILESNLIQTGGSGGETLAAGVIFAVPALILAGQWTEFHFWKTTMIVGAGGILGVLMMVLFRPTLIASKEHALEYPEGKACAEVLQSGERPGALKLLLGAFSVGGLISVLQRFHLMKEAVTGGVHLGSSGVPFALGTSPALLSVGYIIKLNKAFLVFLGGTIAWLIGVPLLGEFKPDADVFPQAQALWASKIRYLGVGAMVVGGVWTIIKMGKNLVTALKGVFAKRDPGAVVASTERDISQAAFRGWLLGAMLLMFGVYFWTTGSIPVTLAVGTLMLGLAFFVTAMSSYVCGLVGSSNNPISGMTILTLLVTALAIAACGLSKDESIVATLTVAAVVCVAAANAGNTSQDLKTGYLVGATPAAQQAVLLACVVIPAFLAAPVLQLLADSFGWDPKTGLPAPQARLFASLAKGFFGGETLPWNMVASGAGIGVLLIVLDTVLEARKSSVRLYAMPVAIGMYLPLQLSAAICLGGLLHYALHRSAKVSQAQEKSGSGVLFASGLIAGESILGIAMAVYLGFAGKITREMGSVETVTGLIAVAIVLGLFAYVNRRREEAT